MDLTPLSPFRAFYCSRLYRTPQNSPATRFFDIHMGPHDLVFSYIPTKDLVHLMCTCRRLHSLVKKVCFDLHRLLLPFFGDATEVERFRLMQSLTDTLISGSTALQYFNRVTYRDSDLDIYVYRLTARMAVDFIVTNGYTFDPRKSQKKNVVEQLSVSISDRPPSYLGRGIADVLDFHKGNKKIQVIVAESTPMETILSFHSTVVMNIITPYNAFALYPHSTFVTKEALIVETVGAGQELGRQKYVDRGWSMTPKPSLKRNSELGVRRLRWVGDKFTWTITLPPLTVNTTDMCCINSWQLENEDETTETTWKIWDSPVLRYKYIRGDAATVNVVLDEIQSRYSTNLAAEFARALSCRREEVEEGLVPF
ncbi:DUF607-domain-containing protein [Mycena venus]|uniref:DUF607-domain-containing protein n=1 Tax=Mycena venus TaxID=2733690 RepID=A0A8H7CGY5_9AGAR|nr:DUF607-domain-containing protein [Mycena venus]